jgi:hypothetical protein
VRATMTLVPQIADFLARREGVVHGINYGILK